MAQETINDWVVELGFDTTAFDRGMQRVERRLARLARMQERLSSGSSEGPRPPREPRSPRPPAGGGPQPFQLDEARQLRISNTIDSVMRRAGRRLDETSQDFQEITRDARRLQTQIGNIGSRVDLERVNNQIRELRDRITSAAQAERRLTGEFDRQNFTVRRLRASLSNLGAQYVSVFAIIAGGGGLVKTASDFDSLNAALLAASGSTEQAASDFEFIKRTALSLGIGLNQVADGYKQIGVAGSFSNFTTDQTKEIFLSATEASRAFGLSAERSGLVFRAFSQIISKGKVSQEELRQQLGDSLPGALGLAAKAMGVTTEELNKMVEKGISAQEFLPKFAAEIRRSVRDTGALAASMESISFASQNFASSMQLLSIDFSEAGGKKGIVFFLEQLTEVTTRLQPLFRLLGRVTNVLGRALGGLLRLVTVMARPFIAVADAIADTMSEMADAGLMLDGTNAKMDEALTVTTLLARAFSLLAAAILAPFAAMEAFTDGFEELQAKVGGFEALRNFDKVISEVAVAGIARIKAEFGGASNGSSTVNSGNNFNVNIDASSADAEGVASSFSSMFQDILGTAEPNN